MSVRKPRETDLVRLLLEYLTKARRFPAFRMNTGCLRDATGRPVRFGTPGMADIVCLIPGRCSLWIEAKMPTGKTTELQDAFGQLVQSAQHRYCVVRSLAELEAVLKEFE